MNGIIDGINQKTNNFGILLVDGTWHNGFGQCTAKKGDAVEFVETIKEKDGKSYTNIDMKSFKIVAEQPKSTNSGNSGPGKNENWRTPEQLIRGERLSEATKAIELYAKMNSKFDGSMEYEDFMKKRYAIATEDSNFVINGTNQITKTEPAPANEQGMVVPEETIEA